VKEDRLYLEHIRQSVGKILGYTAGGREEFMKSSLIQDAVVRNFEIIGEAAKRLSEPARRKHPHVPWNDIARFRDVLIHHYMGVDLKRVWNVVDTHLPALRQAVEDLLKS